jgi:hypothetical protein
MAPSDPTLSAVHTFSRHVKLPLRRFSSHVVEWGESNKIWNKTIEYGRQNKNKLFFFLISVVILLSLNTAHML